MRRLVALDLETLRGFSAECGYNATALAKRLNMSLRQLQRLFRRQIGCPPRTWLREERLQIAHRLLLGSASIKEVSLTLSFRQPSQFCRDFRKRFGYTPSTLKKSKRVASPAAEPHEKWRLERRYGAVSFSGPILTTPGVALGPSPLSGVA